MSARVLLVEDDMWLAELESQSLQTEGYDVTHVPHAEAAIDRIDDLKPDVLVMDMLLTGSTALTLLHELQTYPDTKAMPVVLCTNLADGLSEDDLRPYGVKAIIDKTTMRPDDLVAAVRKVLL